MTASKLCPHPGCTKKIERKAQFCRQHTDWNHGKPPVTIRTITCAICGEAFDSGNPRQKYCPNCHETTCEICGKRFTRRFGNPRHVTTCSASCAGILAGRSRTRQMLTCQWCGVQFSPANGHLGVKYCSRHCKTLASRKPDSDKKRNSYRYRQWRNAVFERDNCTCQQCGATGEIQAHHIKPWEHHRELRYDVANGITLCQTCHENIHGARIPRVSKRFPTTCTNCGRATKGHSLYCRACGVKLSQKAKRQRESLPRNENGQFVCG